VLLQLLRILPLLIPPDAGVTWYDVKYEVDRLGAWSQDTREKAQWATDAKSTLPQAVLLYCAARRGELGPEQRLRVEDILRGKWGDWIFDGYRRHWSLIDAALERYKRRSYVPVDEDGGEGP
jgi:hypothetical protein